MLGHLHNSVVTNAQQYAHIYIHNELIGNDFSIRSDQMSKAIKSKPTNITLPGGILESADETFWSPLKPKLYGRPSRSMVIRALLEIALENGGKFRPENADKYETFRDEIRRILTDRTEG